MSLQVRVSFALGKIAVALAFAGMAVTAHADTVRITVSHAAGRRPQLSARPLAVERCLPPIQGGVIATPPGPLRSTSFQTFLKR
jgi:hypothetical protein